MTHRDKAVAEVDYTAKPGEVPKETTATPKSAFILPSLPRELPDAKEPDQPADPKSLSIALIGAPNAGKSTLINHIANAKVRWIFFLFVCLFAHLIIFKDLCCVSQSTNHSAEYPWCKYA